MQSSTLSQIQTEQQDPAAYARAYLAYLAELSSRLDVEAIGAFITLLDQIRQEKKRIFFIGNGGSAATASHFSNDLSIGLGKSVGEAIRAVSLTDNVAVITAIGNDEGYARIFIDQLKVLWQSGDALVAISASGNSPNIIQAVEFAKQQGMPVVGLTGFEGGQLRTMADIAIHVSCAKGEYGPVEDLHMIVDHLVMSYLAVRKKINVE